jgi:hypothetical protein
MSAQPKELVVVQDQERQTARLPMPPVTQDAGTLMKIIERAAMDPTFDLARLEQMLAMKERWDAEAARRAFNEAFAAFKAEAVEIIKNRGVSDGPLKGKKYAELFSVVNAVTPALSRQGLSASWKLTKDEKDWIEVTCTLRHVLGHSENVSMAGPPDAGGAKNAIQARASTITYLERYTLKAICGVAEQDDDDDGNNGNGKKLDEDTFVSYLKAIDNAKDEAELKSEYKAAYRAAESVGDTHAIKKFGEHKDARKKRLGVKA